jgi:hypothetical protein
MQRFRQWTMAAAILATCLSTSSFTHASDCYHGKSQYKTVTLYQTVRVPVYSYVTKYHSCGTPYRVQVVTYRHSSIPVQKQVRIGY